MRCKHRPSGNYLSLIPLDEMSTRISMKNREIRLMRRPSGRASADDFAAVDVDLPSVGEDEVLVRVRWLSIDPYLNERATGSLVGPMVALGGRMVGRGIGEVLDGAVFPEGTLVSGEFGWQECAVQKVTNLVRVSELDIPETWHLSVLALPGITAWLALFELGQAKKGDVVLITSAAGTVGSIAGQLARDAGLRVVGIASGSAKISWLRELGFAEVVDRSETAPLEEAIRVACGTTSQPETAIKPSGGFDLLLDQVGGSMLQAVLLAAKPRARVILSGHVGAYGETNATINPDFLLYQRLRVEGLLVHDHKHRFGLAREALLAAARSGRLGMRETIHNGLDAAPAALAALLSGRGLGKHLVRVA